MAVFSTIGAAVAGFFGLTGTFATIAGVGLSFAGTIVAGVVAAGLSLATAKVLGVFDPPDLGPDPGVKIQLAPSTDNKIGIAYGRNFMSGPITDVAISNSNDTMHYCITLSEQVEGATYTVNEIFRDTSKLNFSSGNASVNSQTNPNSTNVATIAGKIRCRVYAGGTAASNQIFPSSGTQVAATTMMPHWTNTTDYTMEKLVFAMIEVDYDAENGLTGLGGMTFDVTNSVSNPGDVMIDYLNNTRYGAGMANTIIDVTSITGAANTSLKGYSAEQVSFTPYGGGSSTQDRWQINGYLSTHSTVGTNIAKIAQASASFFLFDTKQGKFKVLPNRSASSTFSLNDNNIVSKISVASTELYSLFNASEVEFNDVSRRDQSNTVKISTPDSELNPNEPENIAKFRLDLVNDPIRASQIANIDLSQSRNGLVVNCTTDFTGMEIDVGDVVDLTNTDFGFTAKEFRVMKHEELLDDSGMITCQLTLLEYNADVYVQPAVTNTAPQLPIDIPTIPITPIVIPGVFDGTFGNVTLNQATYGNVIVNDTMKTFGAGTQLADNPSNNTSVVSGTSFNNLHTPETYDLSGVNLGDYEITSTGQLTGTINASYDYGMKTKVDVVWANTTATHTQSIDTSMQFTGLTDTSVPAPVSLAKKMNLTIAGSGGAASDMNPANATIVMQGYSDISTSNAAPRGFANMGYQFLRVTKGER
jgi:hypothetical protein